MLPYALPDLSVLYNASLCFTGPLCALQCFPMLYRTSLCFTMLPYALPDLSVLSCQLICDVIVTVLKEKYSDFGPDSQAAMSKALDLIFAGMGPLYQEFGFAG
ncbi:UNVERIFIED_CONTAM: hypothetical protein FKN15_035143 [Acipenser sinensis]